jgi:curved DNA-binding protein
VDYKDYYQSLGVSKSASEKDIKQAYRRLARKHHPDVNPGDRGAEARFKELNEAYAVLSDPEKRPKYDQLGANWQQYERVAREGGGGFPPGFEGFHVEYEGPGADGAERFGGFSDFFKIFFGGGFDPDELFGKGAGAGFGRGGFRGRRASRPAEPGFDSAPAKGRDVSAPIDITLEESFRGGHRRLSLQSTPATKPREIEVRIPPGVRNGSRVRVAGKGEPGARGAPPGDLYLEVKLLPHHLYRYQGDDLYVDVPVTVAEAALGAEVEIPTFAGRVRIKVPAGSQSGRLLRLRGKGMPRLKKGGHGDLLVKLKVVTPTKLSKRERQLLEELSNLGRENPRAHLGG